MRYIIIDLSSDNDLEQPNLFGGYEGEHNETILQVKLPKRMIDIECSGYRFDFQTSEDNKISSPLIPISELNNDILSFHLTQQLTIAGKLLFNVIAILSDENTVSMISKTNTVTLRIEDAVDGNMQLIDPNGYKDELQKMVDERIMEINPAKVDQTFNPESENAQSGKAVAEAVATEKKRSDNTFANALKGTKSGTTILLDDISPVTHEISVVLDVGGATVAKYGKNLAPSAFNCAANVPGLSITDNGDGAISIKGTVEQNFFWPLIKDFVLPRGTYCVSGIFPSGWTVGDGYVLIDGNTISNSTQVITLSERKTVSLNMVFIQGVQYDLVMRPQIEVGTTATEWEKYKEPIIYTADKSGNVSGIVGNGNDITLTTNDGVEISVKYNKDINKMFAKLTQAIISLGGGF